MQGVKLQTGVSIIAEETSSLDSRSKKYRDMPEQPQIFRGRKLFTFALSGKTARFLLMRTVTVELV